MEYYKILEKLLNRNEYFVVGKNLIRSDALDKCLGKANFTADYLSKESLIVKVFRSCKSHAIIKNIETSRAMNIPGIEAIITARDIPGINQIGYALPDQPLLNDTKVHYIGDPIALICAQNEEAAQKAEESILIEYEELKSVFDISAALNPDSPLIHTDGNVAVTTKIRKGNIEKGFKNSNVIIEDTYWSPYQEHMCLETDGAYAFPDGTNKITVICESQSPHLVREKVAAILGWKLNQVRIIQALTGGAFGKKDDTGPILAAYAALSAKTLGKPSACIYDRIEMFKTTPKRFPAKFIYKSGADKNGNLTAIQVYITLECGAYANRAPFWLWRQTAHAAGPYEVDNVAVDGRAVYTNNVYGGSFRGFGNLALHFAVEQQIDKLAYELCMDPLDFRLKNVLKVGSRTTCDQILDHSVGIEKCLKSIEDASKWKEKRVPIKNGNTLKGWGIGCAYHGNSTSRSTPDWSAASLLMNIDGSFIYRTGICELGQGSPFGHVKIVAEILGANIESIKIEIPDTDSTPDSKPTHGSRGLMMGGTAAADAAIQLREKIIKIAAEMLDCSLKLVECKESYAYNKENLNKKIPFNEIAEELHIRGLNPGAYGFYASPKRNYDEETGLGINYSVYTFASTIAEVEVDTETGEISVLKIWPSMDVGKAIDPIIIEGQIHGALSQGIGFTLMENVQLHNGNILNPSFKDYIVPSAFDTPEVDDPILIEEAYKHSAFGVKGVGEPSIISIVPAIVNAIYHATGIRFNTLPITAERMHKALKEVKK
ncbi:xanthine dehydrogenase family protein [Candidatus Bathyarchaeota archaeon]|nr:xanthine dehydrogenase family protein [Candidatus Bathyarchaeota archaeon]